MDKVTAGTLSENFLDIIRSTRHDWPFKDDFSDIEEGYVEAIDIETNTEKYVLLKANSILRLECNFINNTMEIRKIVLDKIVSCKELTVNTREGISGFKVSQLDVVLQNGETVAFPRPELPLRLSEHGAFVSSNLGRYANIVNKIMD